MRELSSTKINFFPGSVTYDVDLVDGLFPGVSVLPSYAGPWAPDPSLKGSI